MDNIAEFVNFISSIHPANLTDFSTLQDCLLKAGLNDEATHEQPPELNQYFGSGYKLKIWQYPNQFIPYLLFLSKYRHKIDSYLEIGSRYGGTFIFTNEYLKSIKNEPLKSTACDIIPIPTNISQYNELNINSSYLNTSSQSYEFKNFINNRHFSLILVDGDHSYDGVKKDSEACIDSGDIIVFHDIVNSACPGTVLYWEEFKRSYKNRFNFYEFIDQYASVRSKYLGIGCGVKKEFDILNTATNNA